MQLVGNGGTSDVGAVSDNYEYTADSDITIIACVRVITSSTEHYGWQTTALVELNGTVATPTYSFNEYGSPRLSAMYVLKLSKSDVLSISTYAASRYSSNIVDVIVYSV